MTILATVLAAVAVALWRPSGARVLRARIVTPPATRPRPSVPVRGLVALVPASALVAALLLPRPSWVLCGLAGACAATTGSVVGWRARVAALEARTRGRLVEATSLLAADLRAGSIAGAALVSVATELDELVPVARAASAGADVEAELRRVATRPGHALLADVAGAWHVAERGGAPMTEVLERIATHGRDQLELDAEVAAELAPARATARVLAVLPVLGLALGASAGGDPIGVVLGTTVGAGCLLAGVVLASLGVLWIESLTRRAAR